MSYIINVIDEDIKNAKSGDCNGCVVAVALKRELAQISFPLVDIQTIRYSVKEYGIRYLYLTPPEVQEYIVRFDAGDPITPFSFKLTTPIHTRPMHNDKGDHAERKGFAHVRINSKGAMRRKDEEMLVPVQQPPTSSVSHREFGVRRMRVNQGLKRFNESREKGADA